MMKLLVLLVMLGYGVFKLVRVRERLMRFLLPPQPVPSPRGYTVTFDAPGGRAGHIEYREGGSSCRFGWELLVASGSVLHLRVPGPAEWDHEVPWAAGRRQQILSRVAEEVLRQKCPSCRWEIDEDGVRFHEA